MAACPNCGRQTLRTKDWACQWCGYPLVSKAYKKIDKTFKELEEERNLASRSAQPEEEPESEPEYEPEPKPGPRPPVKPPYRPRPEPEPASPAELKQEIKVTPEPVRQPEPPRQSTVPLSPGPALQKEETVIQLPPPQPKSAPPPPTAPQAERPPEPLITPPPAPKQELPPAPTPEIEVESEPSPETPLKLEEIQDGMEITAGQVDMLFKTDKAGAHSKFSGKTLVIKGIVEKVFVREHLEIRYIVLTGTRQKVTWSLRCTFNKESSAKLTRLADGQEVKVRGKYDGYSKNIIFKDCVLV